MSAQPEVEPGNLYRVDTNVVSGRDKKPKRPAVVIALPAFGLDDVPLLMRTTDTSLAGVFQPADRSLGLTKDGVFAFRHQRSIDKKYLALPSCAEYLGRLSPQYFDEIKKWWEES